MQRNLTKFMKNFEKRLFKLVYGLETRIKNSIHNIHSEGLAKGIAYVALLALVATNIVPGVLRAETTEATYADNGAESIIEEVATIPFDADAIVKNIALYELDDVNIPALIEAAFGSDAAAKEPTESAAYLPQSLDRDPYYTQMVTVTYYSSTPDQTDDTPFITADGSHVRDGIIASNFLPFGTRVKLPDVFGDKVFEVHDRMNTRYNGKSIIDVWMESREEALAYGKHYTQMEIY